jgi:phosphohistidine phosphatase
MELYLLRHAHAGDPAAWDGPDSARPLSDKGERQADRLGRYLSSVGFAPDAIITSPKVRAARTAELVALHLAVPVGVDDRLGGDLSLESREALIHDAGDPAKLILVGHDPDFSELVAVLVGALRIPMRKGTLARLDTDLPLRPAGGILRWLVPPDLVLDR